MRYFGKGNWSKLAPCLVLLMLELSDCTDLISMPLNSLLDDSSVLIETNNPMDITINRSGYFQVEMPDGSVAYTRNDSFHLDLNNALVTASGYPMVPLITLPGDYANFTVSRKGTVSVTRPGETMPQIIGQLQVVTFINRSGLESLGNGLFEETFSSGSPAQWPPGQNGTPEVCQGYVKRPSYGVVEQLVNMIQAQLAYQKKLKTLPSEDEMLKWLTQL
nr:venom polypeptide precursor [Doratifera vulnerans]